MTPLAGGHGIEPRLSDPKSDVPPLDHPPVVTLQVNIDMAGQLRFELKSTVLETVMLGHYTTDLQEKTRSGIEPLPAWVAATPPNQQGSGSYGEQGRTRTSNQCVNSASLCQLSYLSVI